MGEKIRLNRFIARAGICSRRKADEYIRQGLVRVNGKIIQEMGIKISPHSDVVEVAGRRLSSLSKENKLLYLAMHKPVEVITTLKDPQGRTTVLDLIPMSLRDKGLVPIGRLDYYSEGLLLLSNDGEFVHRMTHPRFHLKKVYEVHIRGLVQSKHLYTIKQGMFLPEIGKKLAPVDIEIKKRMGHDKYILFFTLIQGINRQIRRMCKEVGWKIIRLKRIQHGPISLGNLPPGAIRPLSKKESYLCRRMLGLRR